MPPISEILLHPLRLNFQHLFLGKHANKHLDKAEFINNTFSIHEWPLFLVFDLIMLKKLKLTEKNKIKKVKTEIKVTEFFI